MTDGCHSNRDPQSYQAHATAEAEKARRLIAEELKVGTSATEIADFFKRHQWPFAYEKSFERFVSDMYRSPDGILTVVVDIYVNANKEFVRSEVKVHVTSV